MRISDWSSDVCSSDLVTILAYGTMVHVALATAEAEGIDAEVIDLRTIVPVDIETIEASVKKTGRCVVVHEATRTAGFGAALSALVKDRCFYHQIGRASCRDRVCQSV